MLPLKFSIIIPTHNSEKSVKKCLNSIQRQSYTNFEVILVDDGSTDSTPDLIRQFAIDCANIQVITQENKGVCAARNRGIRHSTGDVVLFCDSDDCLPINALDSYLPVFQGADIDICFADFFYNDGKRKKIFKTVNRNAGSIDSLSKNNLLSCSIDGLGFQKQTTPRMCGAVWAKAFSRSFLVREKVFFDESLTQSEDLYFMFEAIQKANSYYYLETPLYDYYVYPDSVSHAKQADILKPVLRFLLKIDKLVADIPCRPLLIDFYFLCINEIFLILRLYNGKNKFFYFLYICNLSIFSMAIRNVRPRSMMRIKEIIKIYFLKVVYFSSRKLSRQIRLD